MDYSVIIPVYNGALTIKQLAEELINSLSAYSFEIIFVYDCGPDNSWTVINQLTEEYPNYIQGIHLSRNYGQHNAIICGIELAKGDFVITMDEDLQHNPKDIHKLIVKQKEGDFDLVYGKYDTLKHSGFRNITSVIMKKLLEYSLPDLHNDYTAFRLIKSKIAKATTRMSNSYTFLDGYLSWITTSIGVATVKHQERLAGESSYTVKKLIEHSINIFVTFSILPIRMLSYTSIAVFIFTLLYSVYIIARKIMYNDVLTGFPTLIISIGIGVSLILLGMGIVGEYIHRINLKTTKKPDYLISKKTESKLN